MNEITSHFIPNESLIILVREAAVHSKTSPQWNAALDKVEKFCRLTDNEMAWLSGIRYLGNYIRPYV